MAMEDTVVAEAPLRIGNLKSSRSNEPIVALGIEGSANKVSYQLQTASVVAVPNTTAASEYISSTDSSFPKEQKRQ